MYMCISSPFVIPLDIPVIVPSFVQMAPSIASDDQSTILTTSMWGDSYDSDDCFNLDDWPESVLTAPIIKKKSVTWNSNLEFPRYFNKDDCPYAAGRDAPFFSSGDLLNEHDDLFCEEYQNAIEELFLSCEGASPL